MLKRMLSSLLLTLLLLSLSATAFGQKEMILTVNLPADLFPQEVNAGENVTFTLNNTGKPTLNVDKITIFIGGTAVIDEDYQFTGVTFEEDFGGGTIITQIPHESTGGLQPNDLSWGSDNSSVYINNWTKDVNDPEFTLQVIDDDFADDAETITIAINENTAAGGGSKNVDVSTAGNGNLTIVSEEVAGIVVTNSGENEFIQTAEDNTSSSFKISLQSQPYPIAATVIIPLSKQQTGADPVTGVLKVGSSEVTQVTLDKDNWETGVTVIVESGGGTTFDEDETYTVVTGDPSSADDPIYDAFTADDAGDVQVVDLNNDSGSVLQIDSGFLAVEREEGITFNIPVERNCSSACTTDEVTVKWKTVIGTADATQFDPDPADPNATLTWTDGDSTNRNISITITADDVPEEAMSFTVELYDPVIGTLNDAAKISTVTIPANDTLNPGTISVANVTVNEGVGTATITLIRNGGGDRKISLDWITAEGSATTPEDYADDTDPDTDEASGNVSWNNGDMTDKSFEIAIVDDTDEEEDESFQVNFTLNTGDGETDPLLSDFTDFDTDASVTILANDITGSRGNVIITNAQIVEGNPGDGVQVTLTAERTGGTDGPITITWMTADGDSGNADDDAIKANDYEEVTDGAIAWADEELGSRDLVVNIVEDTVEETAEFFKVLLAIQDEDDCVPGEGEDAPPVPEWCGFEPPLVQYPDGQLDHARVEIADDDAPGDITVVGGPVTVGEGAGTVTVTLNRGPGTQGDISVDWATADGNDADASKNAVTTGDSADGLADYTSNSGTVSWDNVSGTRSFDIVIDNDEVVESTEGFRILLTLSDGSDSPSNIPSEIAVQIIDNDSETASTITVPASRVVSESSGVVNITLQREGTDGIAWVNYVTMPTNPVSALPGDQYDAVVDGQVQFADGASFAVASVGINVDENDINEKFLVVFSKPAENNEYELPNTTTEVTITDTIDNRTGEILINVIDAVEGSPATVTLERVNGSKGDVILDWTMSDGTAKSLGGANNCAVDENSGNDNDYTRTASGTITWADGTADVREVVIPTLEDECVESVEFFNMSFVLDNDSESVDLSTDVATINIIDNDGGGTFQISDNSIFENQFDPELLKVERLGGSQGFVFMEYSSVDGTAVADGDYIAISGSLTWADGDSTPRYITTTIRADTLDENRETFTVELFNEDSERPIQIIKPVGTVTIIDPFAIPTLSQWGLIIMMLMLGWVGYRNLPIRAVKLK